METVYSMFEVTQISFDITRPDKVESLGWLGNALPLQATATNAAGNVTIGIHASTANQLFTW